MFNTKLSEYVFTDLGILIASAIKTMLSFFPTTGILDKLLLNLGACHTMQDIVRIRRL
jgi:hypothetical protein